MLFSIFTLEVMNIFEGLSQNFFTAAYRSVFGCSIYVTCTTKIRGWRSQKFKTMEIGSYTYMAVIVFVAMYQTSLLMLYSLNNIVVINWIKLQILIQTALCTMTSYCPVQFIWLQQSHRTIATPMYFSQLWTVIMLFLPLNRNNGNSFFPYSPQTAKS